MIIHNDNDFVVQLVSVAYDVANLINGLTGALVSLLFALVHHTAQILLVGCELLYTQTEGLGEVDHILGQLFLHVAIADLTTIV